MRLIMGRAARAGGQGGKSRAQDEGGATKVAARRGQHVPQQALRQLPGPAAELNDRRSSLQLGAGEGQERLRRGAAVHRFAVTEGGAAWCAALCQAAFSSERSVAAGHRVGRPRGTGSVGDSVGEGTGGGTVDGSSKHVVRGLCRSPLQDATQVRRVEANGLSRRRASHHLAPFVAQQLREDPKAQAVAIPPANMQGKLPPILPIILPHPSPTLSPTDPEPRGLLTLCMFGKGSIGRYPSEMRKDSQHVLRSRVHALCHAPRMRGERGKSVQGGREETKRQEAVCADWQAAPQIHPRCRPQH